MVVPGSHVLRLLMSKFLIVTNYKLMILVTASYPCVGGFQFCPLDASSEEAWHLKGHSNNHG